MQPVANEKCDDVESASVQKQPGSTKGQKCYEATSLIFSHAIIILCMHLGQVKKQSFILCFKLMHLTSPFCVRRGSRTG